MSIKADFHLHSSFSGDSITPMELMIQKGISLGLTHMCFTEHNDFDYPEIEDVPFIDFTLDVNKYKNNFYLLKEKYIKDITLCFGIELGLQTNVIKENNNLIQTYDFDFVIGSSHICNHKDPYFPYFYEGRTEANAYREYFESILENIQAYHNFDCIGHLDYVLRYGPTKDENFSYDQYKDIFEEILIKLIHMGKGIELNTGGVKNGLKELHPCNHILKRYKELGGEIITIGSDSHNEEHIGDYFSKAEDVLKTYHFDYYTIFEKRKPKFIKL